MQDYVSETAWTLQSGIFKAVLDIDGDIALGLLKHDLVAAGHSVADPSGEILRRGIEVHDVVEMTVVQHSGHLFLYMCEIRHHPVAVELPCAAEHHDDRVVAVQAAAFALIIQGKAVRKSDFK